jgi:solute carrier family 13 (sodium-dependent dicarboxylate transporter), member 2/3/5
MEPLPPPWSEGDAEDTPFDLWRRRGGLILAPVAFALGWYAAAGLDAPAHRLAAILAAVIVLWVSEAIPMVVTAFLGVSAAVVLGVAPAAKALAPFADPLVFLFIGTFMLARAIFCHGLDRRFAFAILSLPGIGEDPRRVLAAYALVAACISMWISNTATTAMMFPIGISLLAVLEGPGRERAAPGFASALLLSNALAASIGGLATPVGTPPNLIGIGFIRREAGYDVTFFAWMALGLPVVALLFSWMIFDLLQSRLRGERGLRGVAELVARERNALGPWTRAQRNTIFAFGLTVALWVLPGALALFLGTAHPSYRALTTALPEGVVALLGAALLFLLPVDWKRHEFTLRWSDAVQIDWWIVFLYGGGIALGTLAFETGLAEAIGRGLTSLLGIRSDLGLLVLATAIATLLSETTSNTASANMIVPVVIAIARSAGLDPVLPAIGATMGASLGFMLPVSTPCNAIVYASGRIPLSRMIRHGIVLDVVGVIAIVAVVALLGPLVRGQQGGL